MQSGAVTSTQAYTYDVSDRILSVCFQAGTCPAGTDPFVRWTYDKVGNRLTEARPGVSTVSYTYDFLDELTQAGTTAYTYNQNGNQTAAGTRTLTYDLANRLKTTALSGTTTTYSYDGDGARLQASTGTQASKKTNYLWDTSFGIAQLALERDGNNALQRRYVYGVRRISMFTGGTSYYYHYDALGSMRNLTNASGVSQWTDTYEPYGPIRTETKNSASAPTNLMKFTGEYNDPTGLYHLRARQYDPVSGRFPTVDSAGQSPRGIAISAYLYAGARPLVMADPGGTRFSPSGASFAAVLSVVVPSMFTVRPGDGGGGVCAARPGYPLAVIGEYNGGVRDHINKDTTGFWQNRTAVDLNAPWGTLVCSIFGGVISPEGTEYEGYGLKSGPKSEGFRVHLVGTSDVAFYTHMSGLAVRQGERVKKGTLIGFVGCGSNGATHLHLALRYGNPERYSYPRRKAKPYPCLIPPSELAP